MINIGNQKIRLFTGSAKVKAAYLGAVQVYSAASLSVTPSLAFAAAGGSQSLVIDLAPGQAWSLSGLPAGWTASATGGTGSATVAITASNNTATGAKGGTITVVSGNLSAACAVSQEAGRIVYETPVVTAFSYPDIPAAGGTVTPDVYAYQQVYTWNGVPGSGGVLTTGGTVLFSENGGAVYAPGLGTTVIGRNSIAIMYTRVDMNGVTGQTVAFNVCQAENRIERYDYGVVATSAGSLIPWSGGRTTVSAKSQRAATYTSGAVGGWEDNPGQTVSATIAGSGFSLSLLSNVGASYAFDVTADETGSSAQRTATVTFRGSVAGSATAVVRQEAMPLSATWRNTSPSEASQYPEFFVEGNTTVTPITRNYTGAITYVHGHRTTYHNADLQAETLYGLQRWFGLGSRWSSQGSTFMGFTDPGGFMNGYEYRYTTIPFTTSTPAGTTLRGIALVQKSDGDFEAAGYWWPPDDRLVRTAPDGFSEEERTALRLLAERGTLWDGDDPVLASVDFEALAAKINARREPDCNEYVRNEDGTWTVVQDAKRPQTGS